MEICILCLNLSHKNEILKLAHCRYLSESGEEIIKKYFSNFIDKIFDQTMSNTSKNICNSCWSHLTAFHDFYTKITANFELQKIEDIKVKSEPCEDIFDSCDWMNKEDTKDESFEKIEEVKVEVIEQSVKPKKSTKTVSAKKSAKHQKIVAKPNIDEGDERIAETVKMICDICSTPVENFSKTLIHFKKVHGIKGYLICCGKKYMKRYRLLEHLNSHYNIIFPCDICGKTFFTKDILRRHEMLHADEKVYQCDNCPKSFVTKFQIRNHLVNVHLNDNVVPSHKCPYNNCSKVYVNQIRLEHHIKYTHSGGDHLICEICSRTFVKKCYLVDHMRSHTKTADSRVKCEICGHFLAGPKEYRRHLKNHETEAWDNTCSYCGRRSKTQRALKKHIWYVHQIKPKLECQYCGKFFKRSRDLTDHIASIHTQEDIYSCDFCSRTFRCQTNMLSHRKRDHPEHYQLPVYMRETI